MDIDKKISKMLDASEKHRAKEIKRLKTKKNLTIFEAAQLSVLTNGGSISGDKSGWATPYNW